jgi:exosome complex component MTR3
MYITREKTNTITLPEETWDPLSFLDEKNRNELIKELQKTSSNTTDEVNDEIFVKTSCISEAKGSCYIEIANTKVICGLYGPREIPKKDEFSYKLANLNCEFRFATFSLPYLTTTTSSSSSGGTTSQQSSIHTSIFQQQTQHQNYYLNQSISSTVKEALKPSVLLHKYPKSQIDIYIICLQSDLEAFYSKKSINNTIISASIIAGSMALVDASIECYDLVSSYTNPLNNLTISYMNSLDQITSVYYTGNSRNEETSTKSQSLSINLYKSLVKDAVENCKKIYLLMKYVLVQKEIDKQQKIDKF